MFGLDLNALHHASNPGEAQEHLPRDERVAAFNRKVEDFQKQLNEKNVVSTTLNYQGKVISSAQHNSLTSFEPICIHQLQFGVTHKKRVLYARIVSKALVMVSAMVLVEDQKADDITRLAVYGLKKTNVMQEGRYLAIKEPHYKIHQDGTPGIRVDDPMDIVWDVEFKSASFQARREIENVKHMTVEDRLHDMFIETPKLGVDKAFQQLSSEGYNTTKKQVRSLKKTIVEKTAETSSGTTRKWKPLPAILSERRHENHRNFTALPILEQNSKAKTAFKQGDFEAAEKYFAAAIELSASYKDEKNQDNNECLDSVALWQLIGNRSAALYKLGKLDEALQEALRSHRCAPEDAVKPILRCAEIMAALGMKEDSNTLLEDASVMFPDHTIDFSRKMDDLKPKQTLYVGQNKQYSTIFDAVRDVTDDGEIIVDPGVYKESLILTKPLTLRSSTQVPVADTLSEEITSNDLDKVRPVIQVEDYNAVTCNARSSNRPICIVGFKILCSNAVPENSFHALDIRSGLVVVRNTIISSSSGPVVCLQNRSLQPLSLFALPITSKNPARLIVHSSKVIGGAQGGILGVDGTFMTLRQVYVARNAACGLELREGGNATLENCHFFSNGKQGIMIWMSAGVLDAKHCWIHSNTRESGVLVSEGTACLDSCKLYGNGAAGVVTQQRGALYMTRCLVHDNCEGVLIQDTGTATVEKCDVYRNRANGIFVGYDHRGSASIVENVVHDNVSAGILIGCKSKKHTVENNTERDNKGLPPVNPDFMRKRFTPSSKHNKRILKNKASIEQAMKERQKTGGITDFMMSNNGGSVISQIAELTLRRCLLCGKNPPEGSAAFSRCSKCKEAIYCSRECQRSDWPRHKISCRPKHVKYPCFIDNDKSVRDGIY